MPPSRGRSPSAARRRNTRTLDDSGRRGSARSAGRRKGKAKDAAASAGSGDIAREGAKVVRDSFTMPSVEYASIAELKKRSIGAGVPLKKSEVLRAGLAVLKALPDAQFARVAAAVEPVKTGRPPRAGKKHKRAKRSRD